MLLIFFLLKVCEQILQEQPAPISLGSGCWNWMEAPGGKRKKKNSGCYFFCVCLCPPLEQIKTHLSSAALVSSLLICSAPCICFFFIVKGSDDNSIKTCQRPEERWDLANTAHRVQVHWSDEYNTVLDSHMYIWHPLFLHKRSCGEWILWFSLLHCTKYRGWLWPGVRLPGS